MNHLTCRTGAAAALLLVAVALPAGVRAASDSPALYAHAAQLQVSGKEAVARLRLPKEVYLGARSSTLDDLRIFDRNGQPVRFAVRTPRPQVQDDVSITQATIFPLRGPAGADAAALQVTTSANGRVISVNARGAADARADAVLSALVLDLNGDDIDPAPVGAFHLTPPQGIDNYTARIVIEVSNDMTHWEEAGEAPVSWLRNGDARLVSDRIALDSAGRFRYARLTWREGKPLEFSAIAVERRATAPAAPYTESMLVAGVAGRVANDIVFAAGPALPVQSVSVQFGERNVVAPAALGRYIEVPVLKKGDPVRHDFDETLRGTFYRLAQGGKVRTSGEFDVAVSHAAAWVLRPTTALSPPPTLRLTWQPGTLYLLTTGAAPYTLAVGRTGAQNVASSIEQIAPGFDDADLAKAEAATLGPMRAQTLAVPPASEAQMAAAAARSRTVLLWSVLVVGVLAVALMARQLMRQMPQQGLSEEPPSGA